jgi:hypothetical protein
VLLRKRVLTPPIVGCLVGIVAGGLPPLRALLVPPASPLPLHRALEVFGKAYSPAALLVLASSLALPKPSAAAVPAAADDAADDEAHHAHREPAPTTHTLRDVSVVLLVRFLLLPLAFSGVLQLAHRFGVLPADPLRDFVLTMQATMPSAQNAVLALQVGQASPRARATAKHRLVPEPRTCRRVCAVAHSSLTRAPVHPSPQVAGEPARATRMAHLLLIIYLTAALPVALVLSVALQKSGLLTAAMAAA